MDTQQVQMHDLRKQNYVTQGAFMAALLCKADQGAVKSQRGKLDIVCKLLVSAGILEEGDSGGLCIRERKEESKSDVAQQVSDGNGNNTVYLEECLERVEEDIARIKTVSTTAVEEARRAALTASRLRTQVDEKCQQVQKKCCDRLEESLEGSGERIETNSTRIFHLAAEVEGLTRAVKERGAAAKPVRVAREETREVFSVEIADLPRQQTTTTMAPPPEPAASPTQRRQKRSTATRGGNDEHGDIQGKVRRSGEDLNPRPGVLGEPCPENHNHPGGSVRAAFLATSLKHATSPRPSGRRHSTYVGRRVSASQKQARAQGRLVVGPTRPQEDRSVDDEETSPPCLWARASSWPLLANEAAAAALGRLQDVRGFEQVNTDAKAVGETKHKSVVRGDTPNVELVLHGGDRPETTRPTPARPGVEATPRSSPLHRRAPAISDETDELFAGTSHQDDIAPKSQQNDDLSGSLQVEDSGTNRPDRQQPSPSPRSLARMTANEAAEAFLGVTSPSLGRRVNTTEEQDGPSRTAAAGMDTAFRGARLACLADTPGLWCPRDTWDDAGAVDLSSSEGSSTTAAVAEGRRQRPKDT